MKRISFLLVIVALVFTQTIAQTTEKVPEKVKATFSQKFPNATKVKWDKENDQEWEAEFAQNSKEYSANFTTDGTWKETEYEIELSDVPAVVKNTLDSEFLGYKIEDAELSETAQGKVYEFEIEKGESNLEVAISMEGKVLKKKAINEDDEDKD